MTVHNLAFAGSVAYIAKRMNLTPEEKKYMWKWGLIGVWLKRRKKQEDK